MCGIIFLKGQSAEQRLPYCLEKLKHRGPDDTQTWKYNDEVIGFTRLAINGEGEIGRQPHTYGDWVGVVNGEIYNYENLIDKYELTITKNNDTQLILPLFARIGASLINTLDGFYAAILYNYQTQDMIFLRDSMGKKPLFYGESGSEFFVTSELKSIDSIDWFKPVPKGLSRFSIADKRITEIIDHQFKVSKYNLVTSLNNAVKKRLPEAQKPVGVFLSGGLDSSIIAALASKIRPNITYFTLGNESSSDKAMVTKLVKHLELNDVRIIPVPSDELLGSYIAKIVYVTESFNPSIISNGLATYLLAQAASDAGIKVVLTGEGADELFGGYFKYLEPNVLKIKCSNLMTDMQYTELRRLDLCTMAHGVEARCPFLDNEIISLSKELEFSDIYSENMNKVILRKSFSRYLPKEVTDRPKVSFDVGSGIREMVVKYLKRNGRSEREELQEIWEQHFNRTSMNEYFHRYPVFDDAIDRRGNSHR